jgi:hypothetical protein
METYIRACIHIHIYIQKIGSTYPESAPLTQDEQQSCIHTYIRCASTQADLHGYIYTYIHTYIQKIGSTYPESAPLTQDEAAAAIQKRERTRTAQNNYRNQN